jgi:hypothetical protein
VIHKLLNGATNDTPGPQVNVMDAARYPQGVLQVVNTGGAGGGVVLLQGRVSAEAPWTTVATVTLTGTTPQLVAVAVTTEMRAAAQAPIPLSSSFSAWLQAS